MVEVTCDCGTRLRLGDEWAGSRGKCPKCGAVLQFPALAAAAAPPPRAVEPRTAPTRVVPPGSVASVVSQVNAPVAVESPSPSAAMQPTQAAAAQNAWPNFGAQTNRRFWLAAAGGIAAILLLGAIAIAMSLGRGDDDPPPVATADPVKEDTGSDESSNSPSSNPNANANANVKPIEVAPAVTMLPGVKPAAAPKKQVLSPLPPAPRLQPKPASLLYDDEHCGRIQAQFGIAIPPGATILEIDGDRLAVENTPGLQRSSSPMLLLPKGKHVVQFAPGERPVEFEVAEHFGAVYEEMRKFFNMSDAPRSDELFVRGARAMDVHQAPFLLNLMGGWYISQGKWEAAERKFRRSVRVNPAFAPAHLNLAHCLLHRYNTGNNQAGLREAAARELRLAEEFNIGNVYGLNAAAVALRRLLEVPLDAREPVPFQPEIYVGNEPLSQEDERMVALMQALSKYAVREAERAKVFNNLAVHFDESDKPETALEYFRSALAALKIAGPERFALASQVLSHMTAACRRANFEEADEYAQMQDLVRP